MKSFVDRMAITIAALLVAAVARGQECYFESTPTPLSAGTVSPSVLSFGTADPNEAVDLPFTITNTGPVTLRGRVSENCSEYSIVSGGGTFALAPAAQRVVTIRLQTGAEGTHACTIETGTAVLEDVYCSGIVAGAPAPTCFVSPTTLNFGKAEQDDPVDMLFSIENIGGGTLNGNVTEACAAFSIVAGGGAFSLAAGQAKLVTVRMQSATAGNFGCTVDTGVAACVDVDCSGTVTGVPSGDWITYLGAIRVPGAFGTSSDDPASVNFGNSTAFCGEGLGYWPAGDPGGAGDGYPGSLWMSLRDGTQGPPSTYFNTGRAGELKIPAPVIGDDGDWPQATEVNDIAGTVLGSMWTTQNRARATFGDLHPIPAQGAMTGPRLVTLWSDKYTDWEDLNTVQWCNLDMSAVVVEGQWHIGPNMEGSSNEAKALGDSFYRKWADTVDWIAAEFTVNFDGFFSSDSVLFAMHFNRKGGTQGQGQGLSLVAFAPWESGASPPNGTEFPFQVLAQFPRPESGMETCSYALNAMPGWNLVDNYHDAVWPSGQIDIGGGVLVSPFIVGGNVCQHTGSYYNDGGLGPPAPPYDNCAGPLLDEGACGTESTGYCCGGLAGELGTPGYLPMLAVFDTADFAAVLAGVLEPDEVAPVAYYDLTPYFTGQCTGKLSGMAIDNQRGFIFVMEKEADHQSVNDRPAIHVFQLNRS